MEYIVELQKHPQTLVRELFNHFNGTTYTDLELRVGVPGPSATQPYNTKTVVALQNPTDGPDVPYAYIHYNRIDLATLFSVVSVKLREVDIEIDGSYDPEMVLGEIQRKYGLNTNSGLFAIRHDPEGDVLYALAGNHAFVGESPLVVELSLDSRISLKELNGFEIPAPITITGTYTEYGEARPSGLSGHPVQMVGVGNYAYLVGNRQMHRMDLSTGMWEEMARPSGPGNRRSATAVGTKIYVVGGYTGSPQPYLEVYDTVTDAWTALKSAPYGVFGASLLHHDGKLYMYGGFSNQPYSISRLTTMCVYDIATNEWTRLGEFGESGQWCAGVAYQGKLYYHGGLKPTGGSSYVVTDYTFVYDPATNQATTLTGSGQITHAPALLVIDDLLYVIGGAPDGAAAGAITEILVYDIARDVWSPTGIMSPTPTKFTTAIIDPVANAILVNPSNLAGRLYHLR